MSVPLPSPTPRYQIDWVDRVANLPVFTYDRAARLFTPTSHAAGRVGISQSGEFTVLSVAGVEAMSVDAAGVIRAKEILYRQKPARTQRRIEFIRKTSSVKQVIGYLTEQGQLCAWQFQQGAIPNSTDQMVFSGGAWLNGLLFSSLAVTSPVVPPSNTGSEFLEGADDVVAGGTSGYTYECDLRISGTVETKTYTGGAASGYFYTGGTPQADNANWYRLTVSNPAQTFYLNYQTGPTTVIQPDYTVTGIRIAAGATVELAYHTIDQLQIGNQNLTVTCLQTRPVLGYTSDVGFGPKGLIAQAFRETDSLLESHHILKPGADGGHLLTPDGRFLVFPHY